MFSNHLQVILFWLKKCIKEKGQVLVEHGILAPQAKIILPFINLLSYLKKMKSNSKIVLLNMKDNREKTTLDLSSTKAKNF